MYTVSVQLQLYFFNKVALIWFDLTYQRSLYPGEIDLLGALYPGEIDFLGALSPGESDLKALLYPGEIDLPGAVYAEEINLPGRGGNIYLGITPEGDFDKCMQINWWIESNYTIFLKPWSGQF